MNQTEIERKWRLEDSWTSDWLNKYPSQKLNQAYIVTDPGELRIRSDSSTFWLTAKSDGGLERREWEESIPEWVFDQLLSSTELRINKTRYTVLSDNQQWELDVYAGSLTGLVIVEAEFVVRHDDSTGSTPEELREQILKINLPAEFGPATEVTNDKRYKNKSLAVHGLPKP